MGNRLPLEGGSSGVYAMVCIASHVLEGIHADIVAAATIALECTEQNDRWPLLASQRTGVYVNGIDAYFW